MALDKFYSSKICGLREGVNFGESIRPKKEVGGGIRCPIGYKICGKGGIDKVLCIREQERCPINSVEIIYGNHTKQGYEIVPLDPSSGVS